MSTAPAPPNATLAPPDTAEPLASDPDAVAVDEVNGSGRAPVVFVHELWLSAGAWRPWTAYFEAAGYAPLALDWPGERPTVTEARSSPEAVAGATIASATDHFQALLHRLDRVPALVGHGVGGLLAQRLAGRGLAAATVAVCPTPFRGAAPLSVPALRTAWPALCRPGDGSAVSLSFAQFRRAFANAVAEPEARELFAAHAVPAPGAPLLQSLGSGLNPWTQARVEVRGRDRGPLLVMAGGRDRTAPASFAQAAAARQSRNPGITEFTEAAGRGHSLTVDSGWQEIAETVLGFVRRFA